MKPQHTRGPFAVLSVSDGSIVITAEEGRRFMAYLFHFPDQQERVDAELLAAAPQMREVLEKVHDFFIKYVMVTYSDSYAEEMTELFYEMNDILVKTPASK